MKQILLILIALSFLSCKEEEKTYIFELPETSVISSSSRWGVIKIPYVRVMKEPDPNSLISSAFRQGDIVKILKTTEDDKNSTDGFWFYTVYNETEGWILGSNLSVYDSKSQAENASKMFK